MGSFYQRKSPRANFHDYSGGLYFVTICTKDKHHYFGKIKDGEIHYSNIGEYTVTQLKEITLHYPYAEIFEYVVMPNHIHFMIEIYQNSQGKINTDIRTHEPCVPTIRTLLSVVIGGFKRTVTLYARRNGIVFRWQTRYHDHIIRGIEDFNKIGAYIRDNIGKWEEDCFY